jgi:hypothetical protein
MTEETQMHGVTVKVKDLIEGDRFLYDGQLVWTARSNAWRRIDDGSVVVEVQHSPDGGIGERVWADPDHELQIARLGVAA